MTYEDHPTNYFLVDTTTGTPIPILTTLFDVTISMGFADMVIH
jgi:hypothetical protein